MLPAYGRELLDLRNSGQRPAHPVYVCDSWEAAKAIQERERFALVVQPGAGPVDFSMLRDLDVVVVNIGDFSWLADVLRGIRSVRARIKFIGFLYLGGKLADYLDGLMVRAGDARERRSA